jgi:transposase
LLDHKNVRPLLLSYYRGSEANQIPFRSRFDSRSFRNQELLGLLDASSEYFTDDQSKRQERGKRGAWIDPHGYDAGKKIKGKKRHILVDTQGLLLHALVHSADIQDRDGGVLVMATLFGLHPFLLKLYADGGYQGPIFQSAVRKILRQIDVEIVKRSDIAKGFAVLPKRWIVERTIAWLNRCRRLAKDWECLNRKALAFLRLASIRLMLRKLCQKRS